MATILRTIGGQFRLVGPLSAANGVLNPSFESALDNWTAVGDLTSLSANASVVKFGTTSCKIDVASGAVQPNRYGVKQSLQESPSPGQIYTLSAWIYIPVDLPALGGTTTVPVAAITYYDGDDVPLTTHQTQLTLGLATPDWTRVSFLEASVPVNTNRAEIEISTSPANPAANPTYTFYVDGVRWVTGIDDTYVDGDFAGYAWSGDRFNSTTLTSIAPDALHSFQTNPPTAVIS